MWIALGLAAAVCAVFLLDREGLAVTKNLRAVVFVFRPGPRRDRARVSGCTGWVRRRMRRRMRVRESGTHAFALELDLSEGTAAVSVLDRDRGELLRLDGAAPKGALELEAGGRYYLRWSSQSTAGKCALSW